MSEKLFFADLGFSVYLSNGQGENNAYIADCSYLSEKIIALHYPMSIEIEKPSLIGAGAYRGVRESNSNVIINFYEKLIPKCNDELLLPKNPEPYVILSVDQLCPSRKDLKEKGYPIFVTTVQPKTEFTNNKEKEREENRWKKLSWIFDKLDLIWKWLSKLIQ